MLFQWMAMEKTDLKKIQEFINQINNSNGKPIVGERVKRSNLLK